LAATFSGAQAQVSKDLFLGQLILVGLSTKLTASQMQSIMSGLLRIGTLDKTPFVIATSSSTSKVLEHTSPQARFPCFYFLSLFSCTDCQTDALGVRLWQLMARQATPGVDPYLPVVAPAPQGYYTDTVALYRKYQYIATLTPKETMVFGILQGISHKANFYFPHLDADVRSISGGKSLSTTVVGGRIHATINLHLTATLAQIGTVTETAQDLSRLSYDTARTISTEATALIKKTQKLDVDPWGIGRTLSWSHPNAFRRSLPWHKTYPTVDVTVHCEVKINKMGDLK
jgi:spore germination protein KC